MSPTLVITELVLAAPTPSDGEEFTPVSVSPGLPGFFATFVLAALLVLLLVDMARRVRRMQAAGRVRERYEAQERRDGAEERRDGAEERRDGAGAESREADPGTDPVDGAHTAGERRAGESEDDLRPPSDLR